MPSARASYSFSGSFLLRLGVMQNLQVLVEMLKATPYCATLRRLQEAIECRSHASASSFPGRRPVHEQKICLKWL